MRNRPVPSRAMPAAGLCALLGAAVFSCAPAPVGILAPVFVMEGSGERSGTYSFDLGTEPRDLYFVFNNVSTAKADGGPRILSASFPEPAADAASPRAVGNAAFPRRREAIHVPAGSIPHPDGPSLPEGGRASSVQSRGGTHEPNDDVVGISKKAFYVYSWEAGGILPVDATCRWTSGDDPIPLAEGVSRKLSIWVADDQWDGVAPIEYPKVSQTMVDAMGLWFMGSGEDFASRATSSIYRLVTDMIGAEWGSDSPAGYIPFDQCVTILLTDIRDVFNSANGGTAGYFDSGNNMYVYRSNERLMFVIDAPMFANTNDYGYDNREISQPPSGSSDWDWSPSDYWPQNAHSTLAHEFQHVINFYQKTVLRDVDERSWTNEMCSMAVEDILSSYMGVPGPRGVDAADLSAGAPGNGDGRIPQFNESPETGLAALWNGRLDQYALAYAFGAYLMRNYGGPAFVGRVVRSDKAAEAAVVDAVRAFTGGQEIFATLLKRFSAAVLLSPWTEAPPYYRFNNGTTGFGFTMDNGQTRSLGSMNFFNYVGDPFRPDGPVIRGSDLDEADNPPGYSHVFYRAGKGLSGGQSFSLSLPEGLSFSIVSLPSQ